MKIGLTGSNGFLGSHLRQLIIINNFELVQISFRDKQDGKLLNSLKLNLKKIESCDFVINCCAVKNPQNKYDYFINAKLPAMIQRYINRKKLKCKLIHISTMNVFFKFLDDEYTNQKIKGEKLLQNGFLVVRPGLIWDYNGKGDSKIFKKILDIPIPFHFMINSGNIYRPVCANALSEFIINNIKKPQYFDEVNVLGNKILSLFQLFKIMATRMDKIVIPINSIFLFWLKWIFINKRGFFYTLSQQINKFDRTGDNLNLKNKVYLKFDV